MNPIYEPYLPIALLIVIALGLGAVILVGNALLSPKRKPGARKQQAFECGNPASAVTRARFDVKFYLVAIFFIVFDLEAVFLFPWAVNFKAAVQNGEAFVMLGSMVVFLAVLTVGLIHVWKRGGLEWE